MSRLKWLGLEALFLGGLALLAVAIFALPGCSEPVPPGSDKEMAAAMIACTDAEAYEIGCEASCPAGEV